MRKTAGRKPVHTRTISIRTFAAEDDGVVVEGELRDTRHETTHLLSGDRRAPGTIHHMIIRMHIGGPGLVIRDIETKMPGVPRRECLETRRSLEQILGLSITAGFTLTVRERIGGPRGCAHLMALVLTMASAAVQGFWTNLAGSPLSKDFIPFMAEKYLADTCHVWRKGGNALAELVADDARPAEDR